MNATAMSMQAHLIVYLIKRSGRPTLLNNFQFTSSQIAYFGDILRIMLAIAIQFGLSNHLGWPWWFVMLISHSLTLAVPFVYSIVRGSQIYFTTPSLVDSAYDRSSPVDAPNSTQQLLRDNARPHDYEAFTHTPLTDTQGFRCLLLQSATDKYAIIECQLYDLSIATPAMYEALSYCWENQVPSETILCDNKRFLVTPTCIAALKQLRRRRVGRLLWIDAICIDQTTEGEQERNQQVQIMGLIYSRAAKVIIWLGLTTPESRLAFQYVRFCTQLALLPDSACRWITRKLLDKIRSESGHDCSLHNISLIRRCSQRARRLYQRHLLQTVVFTRLDGARDSYGEEGLLYDTPW